MLVDTGSQLNLIKESCLDSEIIVDTKKIVHITGVGRGNVRTYGEVTLAFKNIFTKFHIVGDSFPIKQDGILSVPFLRSQDPKLVVGDMEIAFSQHPCFELPPRTKKFIKVPVANKGIKEGYVRRVEAGEGIYSGECLAVQVDGYVEMPFVNSTETQGSLTMPPVELEPFLELNPMEQRVDCSDPSTDKDKAAAERICKLNELFACENLSSEEKLSIMSVLYEYPYQFHLPGDKLKSTKVLKHRIQTTDDEPVNVRQYRCPQLQKFEMKKQIEQLLENDIIEPSSSPYNSPVWIVPKKADEKTGRPRWRMVIDYRKLNEKTVSDAYPLPLIMDILDQLGQAKYFSVLDMASGFHQIELDEGSRHKSAFSTGTGFYQFKRMPFGLKTAPATFQRLMNMVLSGLNGIEMFVFMDDVIIYSNTLAEHEIKLRKFLDRIKAAGLTLQPEKCKFLRREIVYLGHLITEKASAQIPRRSKPSKNSQPPERKRIF